MKGIYKIQNFLFLFLFLFLFQLNFHSSFCVETSSTSRPGTDISISSSTTSQTDSVTCDDETAAKVEACLDQVERDEASLPGGPCSSSDWRCICTKQQGMSDCFAVCPSQMPKDAEDFDRDNCSGQHEGIALNSLGGDLMYNWSDLNIPLGGEKSDGNMEFDPSTNQDEGSTKIDNNSSSQASNLTSTISTSTSDQPTNTSFNPPPPQSSAKAIQPSTISFLLLIISLIALHNQFFL